MFEIQFSKELFPLIKNREDLQRYLFPPQNSKWGLPILKLGEHHYFCAPTFNGYPDIQLHHTTEEGKLFFEQLSPKPKWAFDWDNLENVFEEIIDVYEDFVLKETHKLFVD